MRKLDVVVWILLVIGGINWGLVGLFQFDLVATIFNPLSPILTRIIYVLVGIAAIYELVEAKAMAQRWCAKFREHAVATEPHTGHGPGAGPGSPRV